MTYEDYDALSKEWPHGIPARIVNSPTITLEEAREAMNLRCKIQLKINTYAALSKAQA